MSFIYSIYSIIRNKLEEYTILKEKIKYYKQKMQKSTTFNTWKIHAETLDNLQNKLSWKLNPKSSLYDHNEVSLALQALKTKRVREDIDGMIHILRSVLIKNIYSINTSYLYTYTNVGTKKLIEEFLDEIYLSLNYIAKLPDKKLSLIKKLEFFSEAKHSYGRTALMLSGGAIFGLYHIGIIITLMENDILPQVVCGSSVGAIVASLLCCLNYQEIYKFLTRKHEDYDGPFHLKFTNDSIFEKIYRLLTTGALRDIEVLRGYLRELLGDITFKEAFNKTGRILNINVTGYKEHDHNRLLNYITSPNVLVFSAACASSAAPIMFNPTELLCKNEYGHIVPYYFNSRNKKYIDGSMSADVPMKRLSELFNVNNFLVSQVNPWVIPFLDEEDENKKYFKRNKISVLKLIIKVIISEIRHRLKQLQLFLPHYYSQILNLITQEYTGDITVFPEFCWKDACNLITNPTELDYHRFKIFGNKRIFHKISLIKSIVKTEIILENCYLKLKKKLHKKVLNDNKRYSKDNLEINNYNSNNLLNNIDDHIINIKKIEYNNLKSNKEKTYNSDLNTNVKNYIDNNNNNKRYNNKVNFDNSNNYNKKLLSSSKNSKKDKIFVNNLKTLSFNLNNKPKYKVFDNNNNNKRNLNNSSKNINNYSTLNNSLNTEESKNQFNGYEDDEIFNIENNHNILVFTNEDLFQKLNRVSNGSITNNNKDLNNQKSINEDTLSNCNSFNVSDKEDINDTDINNTFFNDKDLDCKNELLIKYNNSELNLIKLEEIQNIT